MTISPETYLNNILEESQTAKRVFVEENADKLLEAAKLLSTTIKYGGKILIFGNGGSAADSQHMAAELTGRLLSDRRALPAIALTTDTSALTAIANDFGYEHVFARQIEGLANAEDVVIAISTSGNSKNVLNGVYSAFRKGCYVIGLTGEVGGELINTCNISLNVSEGKNSCRIQETHIFAIHAIVDIMERYYLNES